MQTIGKQLGNGTSENKKYREKAIQTAAHFRVLYAESNEDACLMMKTLLGFSNVTVESIGTANDALCLARGESFDLFLLDTRFPDGDGFQLCRRLRVFVPYTLVIFYSGDARLIEKEKGIAAGAYVYLVKPFSDEVVSAVLQFQARGEKNGTAVYRSLNRRGGRLFVPRFSKRLIYFQRLPKPESGDDAQCVLFHLPTRQHFFERLQIV